MSGKSSICKGCFKSFPRKDGYSNRFCSLKCRSEIISTSRCKPFCKEEDNIVVEVTFKDGTLHSKKICRICRNGKFISKNNSFSEKTEILSHQKVLKEKYGDSFYTSLAWLRLRYEILKEKGHICNLCGSTEKPMHVDHIKPRSKYPKLSLERENLQVLCKPCNIGKGTSE